MKAKYIMSQNKGNNNDMQMIQWVKMIWDMRGLLANDMVANDMGDMMKYGFNELY
jgi:hypothetical protein